MAPTGDGTHYNTTIEGAESTEGQSASGTLTNGHKKIVFKNEQVTDAPYVSVVKTQHKDSQVSNPITVANNDKITYTIEATNESSTDAKSLKIVDPLPDGLVQSELKSSDIKVYTKDRGGEYEESQDFDIQTDNQTVTVSGKEPGYSLKAGVSVKVEFTITVSAENIPERTWKNHAYVTYDNVSEYDNRIIHSRRSPEDESVIHSKMPESPAIVSDDVELHYMPEPKLELEKFVALSGVDKAGKSVRPGDVLTYPIKVSNMGYGDARDVKLEDLIPESLELIEDSISDDGVYSDGTITWHVTIAAVTERVLEFSAIPTGTEDRVRNVAVYSDDHNTLSTNAVIAVLRDEAPNQDDSDNPDNPDSPDNPTDNPDNPNHPDSSDSSNNSDSSDNSENSSNPENPDNTQHR